MATHTKISCDFCGNPADRIGQRLQVAFNTEQTEGRSCKPYLDMTTVDLCAECYCKILKNHPIQAWGAQGHNTYEFKKEALNG